jgi:hypothetical protein
VAKLVPEPVLEPVLEFMPEPSSDSRAEDVSAASKVIERWELAAFNNLCASKYESMERDWAFSGASLVSSQRMERLVALAKAELPGVDIRATGATATDSIATGATTTSDTATGATPLPSSPSMPTEG